jgi:hypothetical protein
MIDTKKTQFTQVALSAQKNAAMSNISPKEAWENAVQVVIKSKDSRKKGCPKETFLSLCAEGLVEGIPKGNYTNSKVNRHYALKAIQVLKDNPENEYSKLDLWNEVIRELEVKGDKVHNQQMDVVLALWNNNLINNLP